MKMTTPFHVHMTLMEGLERELCSQSASASAHEIASA
jgi:hypothetical protein